MDVHVVSDAVLSSTGTPASLPTRDLKVRGKVIAPTRAGDLAIRGATVRLTPQVLEVPRSTTLSDAAGNFLLCSNVPGAQRGVTLWLRVDKDGYLPATRAISIGVMDDVILELVRD